MTFNKITKSLVTHKLQVKSYRHSNVFIASQKLWCFYIEIAKQATYRENNKMSIFIKVLWCMIWFCLYKKRNIIYTIRTFLSATSASNPRACAFTHMWRVYPKFSFMFHYLILCNNTWWLLHNHIFICCYNTTS